MNCEKVKIADICKYVTSGGTPLSSNEAYYNPPTIPWLKTKEVNYCRIYDTESYISQEGLDNSSAKLIPENSVIVAMYGQGDTAGRVAINKVPLATNQACCNLIIDETKADYRYIYYIFSALYAKLVSLKNGGAQPNLNASIIKNLEINIPSLLKQHHIADMLSNYDNLIENNQKQIKLLEEAAQRLYKEWFVDLHFPGYESTTITDGVPERWTFTEFSNIFEYVRGKSYTSKELSDNQGTLMVNLKNIQAFGGYNRNAEKRFMGKYKDEQMLDSGDVVMGVTDMTQERRLVGHVAIIPALQEKLTFSMDLIKLIPKRVTRNYLYCAFRFGVYSSKVSPLANGVNVLHLKPEAMMNLKMLVPEKTVMNAFDKQFEIIRLQIDALEKQIELSTEARDRLLPKLMSGEIEV